MSAAEAPPVCPWKSTKIIALMYGRSTDAVWKWCRHGILRPFGRLRLNHRVIGGELGIVIEDVEIYFSALEGDPAALATALGWKCNKDIAKPVSRTPAAAELRARKEQNKARKALGK